MIYWLFVLCNCFFYRIVKAVQGTNELYTRTEWFHRMAVSLCKIYAKCTVPCLWLEMRMNKCFSVIAILFLVSAYSSQSESNTSSVRGQWCTSSGTPTALHICLKINYCCCSGSNVFIWYPSECLVLWLASQDIFSVLQTLKKILSRPSPNEELISLSWSPELSSCFPGAPPVL